MNGTVTQAGPNRWIIQGRELNLPVKIRDARLAMNLYRTPAADARALLAHTPFRPLTIGRSAISVVLFVRYLDGDLDSYDEFGIGSMVRGIKGMPGVYVHHLPVTGEFTMYAGRWIWGLPKYQMRSDSTVEKTQMRLDLSAEDQVIVTGTMEAPRRLPGLFWAPSTGWSTRIEGADQGAILKAPGRMKLRNVKVGRKGTPLSWGDHPLAKDALALGMQGAPMFTMTAQAKLSIDGGVVTRSA